MAHQSPEEMKKDLVNIKHNLRVSHFYDWMITPIIHHSSTINYTYLNLPSVRLRAAICIIHSKMMSCRSAVINDMMGVRLNRVVLAEIIEAEDATLLRNVDMYDEEAAVTVGVVHALDRASDEIKHLFNDRFGAKK